VQSLFRVDVQSSCPELTYQYITFKLEPSLAVIFQLSRLVPSRIVILHFSTLAQFSSHLPSGNDIVAHVCDVNWFQFIASACSLGGTVSTNVVA
jgi:hypothetical protein